MRKQRIGTYLSAVIGAAILLAAAGLNTSEAAGEMAIASSAAEPEVIQAVVNQPEEEEPDWGEPEADFSWSWDADSSGYLMKIAMAEAEGESVEGKALVMLVVLNRVQDERFPDTIEEVIFQPKQFSPVKPGGRYYTTDPDEGCQEALELIMTGWDESSGALYFESCKGDSWHSRNLEYLFQAGGHKFYR